MLNILEKKHNSYNYVPLYTPVKKEVIKIKNIKNIQIQDKLDIDEYNDTIYYTPSSKE
jgi:hypothetical protein